MQRRGMVAGLLGVVAGVAGAWSRARAGGQKMNEPAAPPTPPTEGEETLLARAKRVGAGVPVITGDCCWKSNTEILTLRQTADGKRYLAAVLDVNTGKESPLDAFNARWSEALVGQEVHMQIQGVRGEEVHRTPPMCVLSPDGRWLLWCCKQRTWIAASLDGRNGLTWNASGLFPSDAAWLRGAKRWAEVSGIPVGMGWRITKVIIRDLEHPETKRVVKVAKVPQGVVLGTGADGRLLMYDARLTHIQGFADLTALDISGEQAVVGHLRPKLPSSATLMEAVLSPDGERIAWVLGRGDGDQLPREFHIWAIGVTGDTTSAAGWVRGRTEATPATLSGQQYFWPQLVRWAPDGKRLCFTFQNDLYVVRAGD